MAAVQERSQEIGEFLEWLSSKGITLCRLGVPDWERNCYFPIRESTEQLLAAYFEIDLDKAEAEKRALLKELRGQAFALITGQSSVERCSDLQAP
jgi:hypothetical protein